MKYQIARAMRHACQRCARPAGQSHLRNVTPLLPTFGADRNRAGSGPQDDARYFQISVPVQPGNSGGALLDTRPGNLLRISACVAPKLEGLADGKQGPVASRILKVNF